MNKGIPELNYTDEQKALVAHVMRYGLTEEEALQCKNMLLNNLPQCIIQRLEKRNERATDTIQEDSKS